VNKTPPARVIAIIEYVRMAPDSVYNLFRDCLNEIERTDLVNKYLPEMFEANGAPLLKSLIPRMSTLRKSMIPVGSKSTPGVTATIKTSVQSISSLLLIGLHFKLSSNL